MMRMKTPLLLLAGIGLIGVIVAVTIDQGARKTDRAISEISSHLSTLEHSISEFNNQVTLLQSGHIFNADLANDLLAAMKSSVRQIRSMIEFHSPLPSRFESVEQTYTETLSAARELEKGVAEKDKYFQNFNSKLAVSRNSMAFFSSLNSASANSEPNVNSIRERLAFGKLSSQLIAQSLSGNNPTVTFVPKLKTDETDEYDAISERVRIGQFHANALLRHRTETAIALTELLNLHVTKLVDDFRLSIQRYAAAQTRIHEAIDLSVLIFAFLTLAAFIGQFVLTQTNSRRLAAANIQLTEGIAEQQRAEQQLRKLSDDLEARVQLRTAELQAEIAERKRQESALIESEERFRSLFEFSPDAIAIHRSGQIIDANDAFKNLVGAPTRDDLVGRQIIEFMPPEGRRRAAARLTELERLGHPLAPADYVVENASGKLTAVQVTAARVTSGENAIYQSIFRDISELRRVDEERRAHERLISDLLATTQEGYWLIDNEGRSLDLNPAMCQLLGRSPEEVNGQSIFSFVDEENLEIFHREIAARANGKKGAYEIALQRPDGTNIACMNNATPIYDDGGIKIGSIGLWTNISEIKKTQELLENARVEADQANKAKSHFLMSMSHELRTPMNSILGFAQLLESDEEEPLSENQLRLLSHILRGGDHLLGLIDEVLDLAKIEAGGMTLNNIHTDPRPIITTCLEMAHSFAIRYSINVIDETGDDILPGILVDPVRLQQVLLNLLSNAIKYNSPGGAARLQVKSTDRKALRFSVVDDGMGISTDNQESVFTPFNRLGMEGKNIEGTGIGLSLTKHLVELMDGQIGFDSNPESGSTFWVEFKAEDAHIHKHLDAPAKPAPLPAIGTAEQSVLYIEDNPANIDLMEMIFERLENIALETTHTAELGLAIAALKKPDLILMDINLPGIDGIEALARLRADDATTRIPVVAVTSNAAAIDIQEAEAAGFDGYVTKPINVAELVRLVSGILDGGLSQKESKPKRTEQSNPR